jgi:hypothetical protein
LLKTVLIKILYLRGKAIMARWTTQKTSQMPMIGQESAMECWITCYEMMFKASGIFWDRNKIEQKLIEGGCSDANKLRKLGLDDPDLIRMATALKIGYCKNEQIMSLSSLKIQLQLGGPLWIAGNFEMNEGGEKKYYKHVVMVVGANVEDDEIRYVNPWTWNGADEVKPQWINSKWLMDGMRRTAQVPASCQFITPIHAAAITLSSAISKN